MASVSKTRSVYSYCVCVFLCSYLCVAKGQDISVCDATKIVNSPTPKRPVLPNTYRLTAECNVQDKNYSTDVTEYFDYNNNRAAIFQREEGFTERAIYNFNINQLLSIIETDPPVCQVDTLSTSANDFLFGHQSSNPNAKPMYSAYGALRFGNGTNEQYMGTDHIRGMLVDHWKSCLYWPSLNATFDVHWYFSSPSWTMSDGRSQVPVRCYVKGNIWKTKPGVAAPRKIEHTYEFTEFLTDDMAELTTQRFETPSGLICPGRKDTKPLPTAKKAFTFTAEILTPGSKTISYIKEWYDQDMNLVRYDTVPSKDSVSQFGYGLLTQVHDFSEGISYTIDPAIGNCTAQPIDGAGFDAKMIPGTQYVRIRTPGEFFYFDKTKYAYEGIKSVRGVDCDVYITQRNDWPPQTRGFNSTWEWYFATQSWVQSTGTTYDFGMPLMLKINAQGLASYIYNIYQYDETSPNVWSFDTSRCYNYTTRKDFSFKLPGKYQQTAGKNLQIFKYLTLLSIHKVTGLSPTRITNINVDYDDNFILVKVTLLGTAPIVGNVQSPIKQVALSDAVNALTTAVNTGKLMVPVDVDKLTDPIVLVAQPYSLKQETVTFGYYKPGKQKTTFSTGAVVGLAIGMAVLFFIIGFLGVYMYYKKNGGSFNKEDKPMENPAYENAT